MNQRILTLCIAFCCFLTIAKAQNPVATLQHGNQTTVYYGTNAFVSAYNASVTNDVIYLSSGMFTPPASIDKKIKIFGVGHYPNDVNGGVRTQINATINIGLGADSTYLEGMFSYQGINISAKSIILKRCNLGTCGFSVSDNCQFSECVLYSINGGNSTNFYFNNNIMHYNVTNLTGASFFNNIFLGDGGYHFLKVGGSIIKNNVFISGNNYPIYDSYSLNNQFINNLITGMKVEGGQNIWVNNYYGVASNAVFINQTGSFDYTHDYHLKNPATYLGDDGSQIGIYGGLIPYKENAIPSNPYIQSKTIAPKTDSDGNLQINITVKAQDK